MKIISENSENQLFFIPLICLHSLPNDFQKSNFIFSEDQSEKSENQKYFKLIFKIHTFFNMHVKTIFENYFNKIILIKLFHFDYTYTYYIHTIHTIFISMNKLFNVSLTNFLNYIDFYICA